MTFWSVLKKSGREVFSWAQEKNADSLIPETKIKTNPKNHHISKKSLQTKKIRQPAAKHGVDWTIRTCYGEAPRITNIFVVSTPNEYSARPMEK